MLFLARRNLTAHPLRSTLTALAIALGVAMVLAAAVIGQAASQSAERLSEANTTDAVLQSGPAFNTLIFQALLALVGVIVLFTAGFVIANAFGMAVTARLKELGALRTLGMTRRQVLNLVLVEAGLMGLAGALGGVLLGLGLAGVALRLAGMSGNFSVPLWALIASPLIGFTVTVGAALLPALQASRISPLEALKPEARLTRHGASSFLLPSSLILFILIALGLYAFIGKPDVFTAIIVLLPAMVVLLALVALLMPALVGPVANFARPWLIRWVGHAAGRLAADNLQRHPTRAALTAGAMTAGLTMMIAISGLMTVFLKGGLLTFATIAREDRVVMFNLTDPATFRAENSLQMFIEAPPLPAALLARLQLLAQAGQVELDGLDMVAIPAELSPTPSSPGVFMAPEVFVPRNFSFSEGNVEDALRYFAQGPAVLLLPLTAQRLNVQVGDTVSVQTLSGPVDFTVAGIGADVWVMTAFSFADGQKYFGVTAPTFMGISVREGQDSEVVLKQVDDLVAEYGLVAFDMKTLLREFFRIGDQIIGLMNALLLLTVLVAALGVVNTMVINVTERQREIGMLRAIGATQRQVRQMVVAEGVTLGLFAVFAAVLVSFVIVLAYFLLVSPNGLQSLGFRLNWEIVRTGFLPALPVMGQATLAALIFAPLIAGLAAYYPAKQAAAQEVAEATRSEELSLRPAAAQRPEGEPEPSEVKPHLPISFTTFFVTRLIQEHRTRFILSVLGVVIGVAVTIASAYVGGGIAGLALNEELRRMGGGAFGEAAKSIQLTGVSVSVAVGFLIFNAFAMSFTQRRQQLGTLRTLGATRAQIVQLALAEAALIGVIGTVIGLLLGELMGRGFIRLVRATSDFFNAFAEQDTALTTYALACVLGLGVPLIAMLLPARAAAQLAPLTALKAPDLAPPASHLARPYFLLLLLPLLLLLRPPELEPPYDLYGVGALALAWLGIIALALPSALDYFSALNRALLPRLLGAGGLLMADNLRRARARTLITATTLTVGVTLIIAITGGLRFYMHELILSRMEDIRAARINLVTAMDMETGMAMFTEGASMRLPANAIPDLQAHFGDRARLSPMGYVVVPELSYFSDVSFSYVMSPRALRDHLTGFFIFTEGDWEHAYPLMENGCGVLIAPFLAKRENVKLYDTLMVTSPLGQQVPCIIAGIGRGQNSTTIISTAAYDAFDDGLPVMLIAQAAPGTDADSFFVDLDAYTRAHGLHAIEMNNLFDVMVKTVAALPVLFNGILLFAILAATLGVVNTTLISLIERRRELGQLRALGLTRRQTLTLVVGEAALIGLFGAVIGVIAGAGLVLILTLTLGGKGMGFTDFPIYAATFRTLGAAMVNGVAALIIAPVLCALVAYYPTRDALRGPIVELLQTEATQRAQHANDSVLPRALVWLLAGRALTQQRARTVLSIIAIALGAAMTIAGDVIGGAIINALSQSEDVVAISGGVLGQIDPILKGIGLAISVAAGFLIFNTFLMSITQRRQQIGTLRSLGMTRAQVLRMVLVEALLVSGAGVALGVLLGPLMGQGVIALLKATGSPVFTAFKERDVPLLVYALAIGFGLSVSLLAALVPAMQATRISPLAALRAESLPTVEKNPSRRGLMGLALLLLITVYCSLFPPAVWIQPPYDLLLTLALSGLWITGIVLALPASIGWLAQALRPNGGLGMLILDNLQRGRTRVLLTIASLAVGLTLMVGVAGFFPFYSQEIFGPTLRASRDAGGWNLLKVDAMAGPGSFTELDSIRLTDEQIAAARALIGERGAVQFSDFVIVPQLSYFYDTYFSFIIDPRFVRDSGTFYFQFSEGNWETALPLLDNGCGLLLTPSVARKNNAQLYDTLTLPGKHGDVTCTIAGIGQTFIGASLIGSAARAQFVEGAPFGLLISPQPNVDAAALESDLQHFAAQNNLHLLSIRELIGNILQVLDNVPFLFQGFLLLAILAAALGMVNTTLLSVTERRQELGQLRAIGATRAQAQAIVIGEAAFIGFIGGGVGLLAGVGLVALMALVYGGNAMGVADYQPYAALLVAVRPALIAGGGGLLLAPLVSALAAYFPARQLLNGSAIETFNPAVAPPARSQLASIFNRGSLQTRFVLGTALLLLLVLGGLIQAITTHASNYMEQQSTDALRPMLAWQAAFLESALPPEADDLRLSDLQALAQFNAQGLLDLQSLFRNTGGVMAMGFALTNRDNAILISTDTHAIGDVVEAAPAKLTVTTRYTEAGDLEVLGIAPLQNKKGEVIGALRLTVTAPELRLLTERLRDTLWLGGGLIVFLATLLAWWLSLPITRATQRLTAHAAQVSGGSYSLFMAQRSRFTVSIRTRFTFLMIISTVALVGGLSLIVIPIERAQMERTVKDSMLSAAEWLGSAFGQSLDQLPSDTSLDMTTALGMFQDLDPGRLRELTNDSRAADLIAYLALTDAAGEIIISDQTDLIGTSASIAAEAQVLEAEWQGASVWVVVAPLRNSTTKALVGNVRVGLKTDSLEQFLEESRTIFTFTGVIAILLGVLLAQALGTAVAAPMEALAAQTRRVAQGDLKTHFRAAGSDELAQLGAAFNDMVRGLQEREKLRDLFGKFVSPEVREAIESGRVTLKGERKTITCLYVDMRGSTAFADQHQPEEVMAALNEYFTVIILAVETYGGIVNRFVGDEAVCIFGAPTDLPDHAEAALRAALAMRNGLAYLNEKRAAQNLPTLKFGMGINTGEVIAGATGSTERQEYTLIGDAMNVGARIEQLNKTFPDYDILLSEFTRTALDQADDFDMADLGEVEIRGKRQAVRVWGLLA